MSDWKPTDLRDIMPTSDDGDFQTLRADWRPIETAPKDGTHILAFCPKEYPGNDDIIYVVRWAGYPRGGFKEGAWQEAGGEEYATYKPTHWMPLPEPPR